MHIPHQVGDAVPGGRLEDPHPLLVDLSIGDHSDAIALGPDSEEPQRDLIVLAVEVHSEILVSYVADQIAFAWNEGSERASHTLANAGTKLKPKCVVLAPVGAGKWLLFKDMQAGCIR